jgi:hypothetical protein
MRMPRPYWLPIVVFLALAGCTDATAPLDQPFALAEVAGPLTLSDGLHILQQAPTAPAIETYEVSFWAHRDRASTVSVNYQPVDGESVGLPFLRFDIPRGGLASVPGVRLGRRDSVLITLTIDPANFAVEFAPSGVAFSRRHPAALAIWYGNADPDLNGDGMVDAVDETLAAQLAIWGRQTGPAPWLRTASQTDAGQQWVWTALYHFSQYAVSW